MSRKAKYVLRVVTLSDVRTYNVNDVGKLERKTRRAKRLSNFVAYTIFKYGKKSAHYVRKY